MSIRPAWKTVRRALIWRYPLFTQFRVMSSTAGKAVSPTRQSTNDYSSWSSEQLVNRVLELENQLRNNVKSHQSPSQSATISTDKPSTPKKPARPFEFSRFHTRRIALKFAYLGASYNGLEHHANNRTPLPTVEEELWKALVKTRLIPQGNGDDVFDENNNSKDSRVPVNIDWGDTEYSKCGRTDRGVSAFGQVISLKVRSAQKKPQVPEIEVASQSTGTEFNPLKDELPYVFMLNRILPPTIRMLAWCPDVPENFDARFSCREREYRYFFTSPGFLPLPGSRESKPGTEYLDIEAMREAAGYLMGTHDFRNLCKIDPSKQITNYNRSIRHASIDFVSWLDSPKFTQLSNENQALQHDSQQRLGVYTFTVKGSAFLWHQVRCMVGVLFLVGQRLEKPSVVKDLLDVENCVGKPGYEMASDRPLVLWNCIFSKTHGKIDRTAEITQPLWERGEGDDELQWIYSIQDAIGADSKSSHWGRSGIMEDVWKTWRAAKMDEILASQLMDLAASYDLVPNQMAEKERELSPRIFTGEDSASGRGAYIPVMRRDRQEPVEVLNARWAERNGVAPRTAADV